ETLRPKVFRVLVSHLRAIGLGLRQMQDGLGLRGNSLPGTGGCQVAQHRLGALPSDPFGRALGAGQDLYLLAGRERQSQECAANETGTTRDEDRIVHVSTPCCVGSVICMALHPVPGGRTAGARAVSAPHRASTAGSAPAQACPLSLSRNSRSAPERGGTAPLNFGRASRLRGTVRPNSGRTPERGRGR